MVYRWGNRKSQQLAVWLRMLLFFFYNAVDCRALGSKDVDTTIPRKVSVNVICHWNGIHATTGVTDNAVLYQQHYTRGTLDHKHEVDIIVSWKPFLKQKLTLIQASISSILSLAWEEKEFRNMPGHGLGVGDRSGILGHNRRNKLIINMREMAL